MKKQYIEPSIQIHNLRIESCILKQSDPPSSGVDNFIDETPTGLSPTVTGGDYGQDPPPFIEGE